MAENKQYHQDYKVQAVKLSKEIGQAKPGISPRLLFISFWDKGIHNLVCHIFFCLYRVCRRV